MWISDRINWIISKRAKPIFFKIKSNQSIYHNKANDVKFGFGVDLLNMMASAVRGEYRTEVSKSCAVVRSCKERKLDGLTSVTKKKVYQTQ